MSHDHEHHDPHLAHHFESRGQQFASVKLGMWVFLATEILMFGGLFCAYSVYRRNNPATFEFGHLLLDSRLGAINTVFLIASSFTMAWGVRTAMLNKRKATSVLLALTLLGGVGFMCIKYVEYSGKFHHGYGPGPYFDVVKYRDYYAKLDHGDHHPGTHAMHDDGAHAAETLTIAYAPPSAQLATKLAGPGAAPAGLAPATPVEHHASRWTHPHPTPEQVVQSRNFIDIYFAMTGLHGVHVLVGMLLIGWLLVRNLKGHFGSDNYTAVDVVGLYWHIVDMIWIFLFPLLYLIHT